MCIDIAMTHTVNSKARGNGRQGWTCDDRWFGGLRADQAHGSDRIIRGRANPPYGPRRVERFTKRTRSFWPKRTQGKNVMKITDGYIFYGTNPIKDSTMIS